MTLLDHALQGARSTPALPLLRLTGLLVVGGGGTLGAAVLAQALVAGRFEPVRALVSGPLRSTLRGFQPLSDGALDGAAPLGLDSAIVVFERQRHNNGRDDAFAQPDPAALHRLAQRLHRGGVRHLIVVQPHAPALLPQALRQGLATLDEAAVAALGFEHLVVVRAAQTSAAVSDGPLLQRLARWFLSQLRLMVPSAEQPLRAPQLARCVVQLARLLPSAPAGTRVLAPETLLGVNGAHASGNDLEAGLHHWLRGGPLP